MLLFQRVDQTTGQLERCISGTSPAGVMSPSRHIETIVGFCFQLAEMRENTNSLTFTLHMRASRLLTEL